MIEPYTENVDGDFYVAKDCCTLCDVPIQEAPQLFTYAVDGEGQPDHCFVSRQPEDESELEDMLRVVQGAELECVRYRGNDPSIIRQINQLGVGGVCDHQLPILPQPSKSKGPWWRFW